MRGAAYVAYGAPAIRCVIEAVYALQRIEPTLAFCVVSDERILDYPRVKYEARDKGARDAKLAISNLVPRDWTQVLYMDADTIPIAPLSRFFEPLDDGWDMVMVRDGLAPVVGVCRLKHHQEMKYTIDSLGTGEATQYAGGAMSWVQNKATRRFFKAWQAEWGRYHYRDQGALVRALAQIPVKIWTLGQAANHPRKERAKELWHVHGRARRRGAQ